MELKLERKYYKDTYTIGKLYIDGIYFSDTLEDKNRDINKDGDLNDNGELKIYGETCIPFGRYKVSVTYSPKFKRNLPRLFDVPHFDGILIHNGRTAVNSHGCILVGKNTKVGELSDSTNYMNLITNKISNAEKNKESVYIAII